VLLQVAAGKDDARVVRNLGGRQVVGQVGRVGEAGGVREGGVAVHGSPRFNGIYGRDGQTVETIKLERRPPPGRRPRPASGPPNMLGGGNDTTARSGGQASRPGRNSHTPERRRGSAGRCAQDGGRCPGTSWEEGRWPSGRSTLTRSCAACG